ncbi:MAG: hypothetical protein WC340_08200 [Kiritimatiellia bacterium]
MKKTMMMMVAAASLCASGVEYVIEAPGGVGDVVALTNALNQCPTGGGADTMGFTVKLKPGIYNLQGITMDSDYHLVLRQARNAFFAGLGDGPEDTVLIGGGTNDNAGVIKCGGGGNYWWYDISNITVTAGYSSANGGGIQGKPTVRYWDCIISNNYAKGSNNVGGGGAVQGQAERCLFADNRTEQHGAGFWTNGKCGLMEFPANAQGATECVFSNNIATARNGGGIYNGLNRRCIFINNGSKGQGGGVCYSAMPDTIGYGCFDCRIIDNRCDINNSEARGGGLYGGTASNCFFSGNSGGTFCRGGAASDANLYDCVITNTACVNYVLANCNMQRCYVTDCRVTVTHAVFIGRYNTVSLPAADTYTNVNCVYERTYSNGGNIMGVNRFASDMVFVNCTISEHVNWANTKYSPLTSSCTAINTLVVGCTPYDVITNDCAVMSNCLWKTQLGGDLPPEVAVNSRQDSRLHFWDISPYPCDISAGSPARDAGLDNDLVRSFVGETDLAGRPRFALGGIDVGAQECQKIPSCVIIIQ